MSRLVQYLAATQDSSAAATNVGSNVDQCRAKIVRFLNLGRHLAQSDEFGRLERMHDGHFEWFGNVQDEDNIRMFSN
jgi:hypothetical protein